ncbi:MAG: manganese efflux pump [Clostridia bacterium]|nr:manganese efflux pump [Clostridia bacterium]
MGITYLFILAVSLSMDAFAVAICKGLAIGKIKIRQAALVGLYFGAFQAVMPTIGYLLGISFREYIEAFDHWIAFGLLAFLGIRMVIEALRGGDDDEEVSATLGVREMMLLAIATSIDALAAGISLSVLNANITVAASFIGIITFTLSFLGVYVGGVFGEKFKKPAEIVGGVTLFLLGLKVLIEHLL